MDNQGTMALGVQEKKINAMIVKAKKVRWLQYDAAITLNLKDALGQVGISRDSYYKYRDRDILTQNLPMKVEMRGLKKAYLDEDHLDQLSAWHIHEVAYEQQTPSEIKFLKKLKELRADQVGCIVGVLENPSSKTVKRYKEMVSGVNGRVTVRTKSRTKALLNLCNAISLAATLSYGFSKTLEELFITVDDVSLLINKMGEKPKVVRNKIAEEMMREYANLEGAVTEESPTQRVIVFNFAISGGMHAKLVCTTIKFFDRNYVDSKHKLLKMDSGLFILLHGPNVDKEAVHVANYMDCIIPCAMEHRKEIIKMMSDSLVEIEPELTPAEYAGSQNSARSAGSSIPALPCSPEVAAENVRAQEMAANLEDTTEDGGDPDADDPDASSSSSSSSSSSAVPDPIRGLPTPDPDHVSPADANSSSSSSSAPPAPNFSASLESTPEDEDAVFMAAYDLATDTVTSVNKALESADINDPTKVLIIIAQDGAIPQVKAIFHKVMAKCDREKFMIAFLKFAAGCSMIQSPNDVGPCHSILKRLFSSSEFKWAEVNDPPYQNWKDLRLLLQSYVATTSFQSIWKALVRAPDFIDKACTRMNIKVGFSKSGAIPFDIPRILGTCASFRKLDRNQQQYIVDRMPDFVAHVKAINMIPELAFQGILGQYEGDAILDIHSQPRRGTSRDDLAFTSQAAAFFPDDRADNVIARGGSAGGSFDPTAAPRDSDSAGAGTGAGATDASTASAATAVPAATGRNTSCRNANCPLKSKTKDVSQWTNCCKARGCGKRFLFCDHPNCEEMYRVHMNGAHPST